MTIYIGTDGNDTLIGGDEDDELIGGLGDDTLTGGKGFDWAYYDSAPSAVVVNLFTGIASGGDGNDTLSGIEGVTGSDFDDTLTGNYLRGRSGNDILQGGKGFDWAYYDSAPSAVVVNLFTGIASGGDGNDTLSKIEGIIGSDYDDTIVGDDNFFNQLWGGAGNDRIEGGDYISDDLFGGTGEDLLIAGADGSELTGGLDNDVLQGGLGYDRVHYDSAPSAVMVNLFIGIASGGDGNDTVIDIEDVVGSNYDDRLIGDNKNNDLWGGAGNDLLEGGDGYDDLRGDEGDDILQGGGGFDSANYLHALSSVMVNLSTGIASGGDGNDTLIDIEDVVGSYYDDTLIGDNNNNQLSGLFGNDQLEGGDGDDILNGGADLDWAYYDSASSAVVVNLSTGIASGGDGNDTLSGIEGINGSDYDDTLTGDDVDNYLRGGRGDDFLQGGNGFDWAYYDSALSFVVVNLSSGVSSGGDGNDTLSGIEGITGSDYDDTLTGDDVDNYLKGGRGDDFLQGGDGFDWAYYDNALSAVVVNLSSGVSSGGDGNDTLSEIEGITGGNYDDKLVGDNNNNQLWGGDGNDLIEGGGGNDILDGGKGWDYAIYTNAPTSVTVIGGATGIASGGDGNDTLNGIDGVVGSSFDDILMNFSEMDGSDGNDQLIGIDTENNNLTGGAGDDLLIGGSNHINHGKYYDWGGDQLLGGEGNDLLEGGDGYDNLWGDAGNDRLEGGNHDDNLWGGEGDDILQGGDGFDWAKYDSATSAVVVNLSSGIASGGDGNDTLSGIEAVTGSNYDDKLRGNDNYSNHLWGGIGDDLLIAGKGGSELTGGLDNDVLQGGRGFDWAHYDSAPSGVVINLSTGIATGGDGNDTLTKIEGVTGSDYDDTLIGGKNNNQLLGGAGNDLIDGADGADYLWGGTGDDILLGGKGNDIYSLDDADDQVIENNKAGTDTIQTEIDVGWSELIPNIENLTLFGSSDLEANGNSLNNILTGNAGANVLDGKSGNDTLKGLDGADYLIGGEGADKFRFENISESGIDLGNRDIVADFFREQKDKIDLSLIDAKLATSKNDAFTWKGTAAFTHIAGELRYIIDGGNTIIEGDIDGDGGSDFQIELIGNIALVSKDFVL